VRYFPTNVHSATVVVNEVEGLASSDHGLNSGGQSQQRVITSRSAGQKKTGWYAVVVESIRDGNAAPVEKAADEGIPQYKHIGGGK